jgi:subtilase family serine protease
MRQIPDVSAVADNLPLFYNGQWHLVSGTSVSAPIWAAGMVLLNQAAQKNTGTTYYGPASLYTAANSGQSPFYDVTQGNNWHYAATSGRDDVSGLGTPNLYSLYTNLVA